MANYINEGDAVGIDISDVTPKENEVYALFLDGDLMIKRIFKEAGGVIRLSSDNKQYADKVVTPDNCDSLLIIAGWCIAVVRLVMNFSDDEGIR